MNPPWDGRDTRAVAAIAGLAFALRLVVASMQQIIGADSPAFLLGATEMTAGDWATSLRNGIHPGYPMAIALVGTLIGGFEAAGYLVSAVCGAMAVAPFYALVRDAAGRRAAVLASLFFACLPYFVLEHADIMTEGLFHFLFVTSLALSWFGATRASPTYYALAAFTGALAYHTRPEGVYAAAAIAGITAFALVEARLRKSAVPWPILGYAAIAIVVFIILVFPLLLWFRHHTGEWRLTFRASVQAAMGAGGESSSDWPGALGKYAYRMYRTTFTLVLPLAVAGFFFVRGRMRTLAAVYFACLVAGYSFAPISAAARGYPLSDRYVLVPVLFLLPFAGLGAVGLADLAARRWDGRRARIAASAILGGALLVLAVRAVHIRPEPEVEVKRAALWLREHAPGKTVVTTNTYKISWYLGRRAKLLWQDWPNIDGDYVLVNEPRVRRDHPGMLEEIERRFRRIARFAGDGRPGIDPVSIYAR